LNKTEKELFFDLPEITKNNMIFSALRARSIGYSLKSIRKSLRLASLLLFSQKAPTVERWNGYKTFRLLVEKEIVPRSQQKVQKYSGWKRHQNDQGSLGPPKEDPYYLDVVHENDNISLFLELVKEVNSEKSEIFINNIRIKLR